MASQFSNMALIAKEMGDNHRAISLYQKALQIFEEISHPYSKAMQDSILEIQNLMNSEE